jgi:molecular chaperone DnaK
MAADNKSLGRFLLDGIPPSPRGVPQIEVAFDIDANGILSVRATDLGTKREQKMTIIPSSGLSKEEIERMSREAEQHAAEDARKREEVEARNMADTLVYTAEKTLREHGDKVPEDVRQEVEGKIAAVRSALQGGDTSRITSSSQELSAAMQKVGQAVYQATGTPPPGEGGTPGSQDGPGAEAPPEGGTIEGEFREV